MILTPSDKLTNEAIAKAQIENLELKKNELRLVGQMKRVPGHTLFSYNVETGEICKAGMVRDVAVGIDGKVTYQTKVMVEPNCYYEQALNKKNFIKRLKRRGYVKGIY